jgi:hypothetical protein
VLVAQMSPRDGVAERAAQLELFSHAIVTQAEGANDRVVSVAPATYSEDCEVWQGDHFSLVNWLNPVSLIHGVHRRQKVLIMPQEAPEGGACFAQ